MKEILNKNGSLKFKAMGASMFPLIFSGDIITVTKVDSNGITIGDIILFENQGSLFVHRLIKASKKENGKHLITKGDSMHSFDNPIRPSQVLGKVKKIKRWGITINPDSWFLKLFNYLNSFEPSYNENI